MDPKEVIGRLVSLLKLDYDAVQAYDKAIVQLRTPGIKNALVRFRQDHQRHVADLKEAIQQLGGRPPELSIDTRGVFLKGMTAIQSKLGEWPALKACETGERYVNSVYREEVTKDFSFEVIRVIQKNYMDERHHLSYIQQTLRSRKGLGFGKAVGLGALGAAAGFVVWREIARGR